MLSMTGKKVLHNDRNNYYGGESMSLIPLERLYESSSVSEGSLYHFLGTAVRRDRDWKMDLMPKFFMANGLLIKLLAHMASISNLC